MFLLFWKEDFEFRAFFLININSSPSTPYVAAQLSDRHAPISRRLVLLIEAVSGNYTRSILALCRRRKEKRISHA